MLTPVIFHTLWSNKSPCSLFPASLSKTYKGNQTAGTQLQKVICKRAATANKPPARRAPRSRLSCAHLKVQI